MPKNIQKACCYTHFGGEAFVSVSRAAAFRHSPPSVKGDCRIALF